MSTFGNKAIETLKRQNLPDHDIHLWAIDSTRVDYQGYQNILSIDEQQRIAHLRQTDKRQLRIRSRLMLRRLLSAYLNTSADSIKIWYGPLKRPHLDHQYHQTSINFNVSHCADLIVIALARTPLMGVDIEQHRALKKPDRLLQRCYSKTERNFLKQQTHSDQFQQHFFRAWTAKEALLKSVGGSVFHNPSDIDLDLSCQPMWIKGVENEALADHHWQLIEFDPLRDIVSIDQSRFSGCIAISHGNWRLERLTYPAD